jgi:hypothetical protein
MKLDPSAYSIFVTYCELCTTGTRAFSFTLNTLGEKVRVRACKKCTAREVKRNRSLRPTPLKGFPG